MDLEDRHGFKAVIVKTSYAKCSNVHMHLNRAIDMGGLQDHSRGGGLKQSTMLYLYDSLSHKMSKQ